MQSRKDLRKAKNLGNEQTEAVFAIKPDKGKAKESKAEESKATEILEISNETHELIAAGLVNPRLVKIGSSSGSTTQSHVDNQTEVQLPTSEQVGIQSSDNDNANAKHGEQRETTKDDISEP